MGSIEREARRDAKEFARAQMFYGEGAGNRRKLIGAKVDSKAHRSVAYARAFHNELTKQDMAEHASLAHRERILKDRSASIRRNVRGIATGDYRNVNAILIAGVIVGYLAHQTGYDKKIYNKGKKVVDDLRTRRNVKVVK